jgi:hypothetical protein
MQINEFPMKFVRDFSLVSFISTSTTSRIVWYLDSGASCYMIEAREKFSSMMEKNSRIHVDLGDNSKYVVKGEGTILLQLESGGSLETHDVIYVPGLKKNMIPVSFM